MFMILGVQWPSSVTQLIAVKKTIQIEAHRSAETSPGPKADIANETYRLTSMLDIRILSLSMHQRLRHR